jgi:iron complex outermembrane receptor protein
MRGSHSVSATWAMAIVLGASLSSAEGTTPSPDPSQGASGDDLQAIVVTGQRRLSRAPEDAKRNATGVVDSVGALEIQQLTDTTVGDALTRIPGIAAQRGFQTQKTWYVDIRGFDGNYNSVDLDGGMFIDSTRNDRAAYLDTVPALAINELVVTKTVTPDMDPNSIGGHISILTLRSFDLGGQPLLRGDVALDLFQQNGAPDSHGPGGSGDFVAKRTFGPDGDFGFVLAASAHNDRRSELYNNSGTYSVVGGLDVPAGAQEHGKFDVYDHGYSVLGKLEARSSDKFYSFLALNAFGEDIDQNNARGSFALPTTGVTATSDTSGTFTNGTAQAYSREYDIDRRVLTFTSGFDYAATDDSKLSVIASYGNSKHNETLWNGSQFKFPGLSGSYDIGANGTSISLAPAPGLADADNWKVTPSSAATITHLPMTDKIYTLRTDWSENNFPFSQGLGFSAGVSLRRLHRIFNQSADNFTLPTGTQYSLSQALAGNGSSSALDGVGAAYVDFGKYWSYMQANGIDNHTTTPTSSYDLVEDALGGYTTINYAIGRFKALAGVRYEYTHEDDHTAQLNGTTPVPDDFTRHYGNVLPNVQASFDVAQGFRVRGAYTETIARPTFTNFAQGLTINNFSSLTPFIRGSNPDLTARESFNYDLSFEFYRSEGYFSLAPFYKNIHHEIYTLTTYSTDAASGIVTQLQTPENAGSSSADGVEVSGDWHDFTPISPLLQGVAVRVNYTWLQGRLGVVKADGSTRTIDGLNQQPRYEANFILAYERGLFNGSLSYSRRGRAFNGIVGATPAGDGYIAAYDNLDLRLGFKPVSHLETFFAAKNLTRSWWREQTGVNGTLFQTAIQDGISFQLGALFQF